MAPPRETPSPPALDLHVHSEHSLDSTVPVWQIVRIATNRGVAVGLADHCGPEDTLDSDARVNEYLAVLDGFPLFRSLELDLGDGLQVSTAVLGRLDYVIGSVHRLPGRDFFDAGLIVQSIPGLLADMMDLLLLSFERWPIDILGHPGLLPKTLRGRQQELIPMSWWERLIAEAGRRRAALELSNRWKLPPPDVVARAMASAGVLFSLGSDAHEVEQVGSLDYPLELVREFGIPRERILVPQRKRR